MLVKTRRALLVLPILLNLQYQILSFTTAPLPGNLHMHLGTPETLRNINKNELCLGIQLINLRKCISHHQCTSHASELHQMGVANGGSVVL